MYWTVPDPHLEIRGARSSRPLDKGGEGVAVSKKKISVLRASVWSKNKGGTGPLGPSPVSATAKESDAGANLLCPSQSDSGSL